MTKVKLKKSCKGKPAEVIFEVDGTEFLDAEFCCEYHAQERADEIHGTVVVA
jgi:hypothetical protein